MSEITSFIEEIKSITQDYALKKRNSGEDFNIFSILQMERKEVKTHSKFISELINPKGRHGQGDLFLRKLLEVLGIDDFETDKAVIYLEYYIGKVEKYQGGRIDILIKNSSGQALLIENKIGASEGINQLERYSNAFLNQPVFYLTLFGEKSQYHERFKDYQSISYHYHIITWLTNCGKEVQDIPVLREAINQYLLLIKKLTHQNNNHIMKQDIIEQIIKDEDSFKAYLEVKKVGNLLYRTVLQKSTFPALDKITKQNDLELHIDQDAILNKNQKWMGFYFHSPELEKLGLCLGFGFDEPNKVRSLIYGFRFLKEIDNEKRTIYHNEIKKEFGQVFGKHKSNIRWLTYLEYKTFEHWDNEYILFKMKYGNFLEDISYKIEMMLKITRSNNA